VDSERRRPISALVDLLVATYHDWRRHRTIRLGAGIAYYGLFAIVPFIAVAITLAGIFISQEDVEQFLVEQLSSLLDVDGTAVAAGIADALAGVGTLTTLGIVGVVSLVLTASLLVLALQDAFNTIWERPVRSGFRHSILRRLGAFAVVAASGGLLIVGFALNAVGGLIASILPDAILFAPIPELFGLASSWTLGIGTLALLFRFLPDAEVRWRSAIVGGALTAVFVAIGTVAIGTYLRRVGGASVAGATSSVFLVLVWIYYEAQIVLAGAELTRMLDAEAGVERRSLDDDGQAGLGPGEDAAVDVAD
jgi:membrane protein